MTGPENDLTVRGHHPVVKTTAKALGDNTMGESEHAPGRWFQYPLWRTPTARLCLVAGSTNSDGLEMIADDEILEALLTKARRSGQWTVTVRVASQATREVEIDSILRAIRIRRSARKDGTQGK
jgi:hypothetical protein